MRELLLFTSKTCAPCKGLKPVLQGYAAEHGLELKEVDVATSPVDVARNNVRAVPTTILMQDGMVMRKHVGSMSPTDLKDFMR